MPAGWAKLQPCKSQHQRLLARGPTAEALSQTLAIFARMPALQHLLLALAVTLMGSTCSAAKLNGMRSHCGLGGPPGQLVDDALPCSIAASTVSLAMDRSSSTLDMQLDNWLR